MPLARPARLTAAALVCGAVVLTLGAGKPAADRPRIVISANPALAFAPVRVVLMAELKGGSDESLYCPSIEWSWGDDTRTASSEDCEPYVAGKTEIKRRWVVDHVFRSAGEWRIQFRLKQKDRVIAQGSTTLTLRGGARDGVEAP
jgi:hypothetical protein